MKPERPTAVTIAAILNIVFGSLGILFGLCGVGMQLYLLTLPETPPSQKVSPFDVFGQAAQLVGELNRVGGPALKGYLVGQQALSLIFCILLLVSGIGLLGMKSYGRWLCVVYAVYATLATLAMVVVQVTFINPTTARVQARQFADMGPQFKNNPLVGDPTLANVVSVGQGLVYLAFSFTLLVLMFLPSVSAAFAGRAVRRRDRDWGEDEEEDRWKE
jgi:hypothetical protein